MTAFALRRAGALVAIVILAPALTYVILGAVYGSIYGHVTVWHQFVHVPHYLVRVFGHLDLGYDDVYSQPAGVTLRDGLPVDAALTLGGLAVGALGGIWLGMLAGPRPRSRRDSVLLLGSTIALSVPVYVLAAVIVYELSPAIGAHPIGFFSGPGTYRPLTRDPIGWLHSLWLPWLLVGAPLAAVTFRMTRSVLHEGMTSEWARTAIAKGLTQKRVLRRHALRAGMPTVLETVTATVPAVITNAILVESVMQLPGMFIRFDVSRQVAYSPHIPPFSVIQGLVLDGAFLVAVCVFACEVLRGWLDPTVRAA